MDMHAPNALDEYARGAQQQEAIRAERDAELKRQADEARAQAIADTKVKEDARRAEFERQEAAGMAHHQRELAEDRFVADIQARLNRAQSERHGAIAALDIDRAIALSAEVASLESLAQAVAAQFRRASR